MTDKEKKEWLSAKYPLTIICDRYHGTYSGAKWLAFPLLYDEIPIDVDGEDAECMCFWDNYLEPVGKGAYANDAVTDLIRQMREETDESEDERIRKQLVDIVAFIPEANFKSASREDCRTYLEKQKEQKPSWSEEEENMRNNIIRVLSAFVGTVECESNPSLSSSYPTYRREIDWLKSLRSRPKSSDNWKPSEEQMKALETAIHIFPIDAKNRKELELLKAQLKKL